MAIYARGARPNRPQSEIIQAALGEEDENGVPFEIIEVVGTRTEADYTSMHGCQDTFIEIGSPIQGKSFTITHRDEGRVRWLKGKFGGRPKALFAKTEKNMRFLAAHFYDGIFVFADSVLRAEVQARAEALKAKMGQKELDAENKRLQDGKTYMHGGAVPTKGGLSQKEIEIKEQEKSLQKREADIRKKEENLKKKEDFVAKQVGENVTKAVMPAHERAELEVMKMYEVRKLARQYYKLDITETMKKTEIIDLIFKPKVSETKVETVTG